jgi:aminoglycoside phosphotransferase (APT) family kinase protein
VSLVRVVSAHHERAVLRVGDVYLKVESNAERARAERTVMAAAPVPTPATLWWHDGPPAVLALAAVAGTSLAKLGTPSPHPPAMWSKAGALARQLHQTPAPPDIRKCAVGAALNASIEDVRTWLVGNTPADPGHIDARAAEAHEALANRVVDPVFIHGDLQAEHVIIHDGAVAAILDWSDAGLGDPLSDVALLTIGHRERLDDVLDGYGVDVDRDVIRGYWALRRLQSVRWMIEHGFDAAGDIAALGITDRR